MIMAHFNIPGNTVKPVPQTGWATIKNIELLALAEDEFDVAVDRNLSYQQNLPQFNLAVIVFRALSSRLQDLRPLVPKLLE